MAADALKRLASGPLPAITLVALLLVSLFMMSESTQNSAQFGRLYVWLLGFNVAGLVILVGLILFQLVRLARQVRHQTAGARLSLRLVLVFGLIAVAPVSLLYYFSLQFLHRGIDSWFDVRVEEALTDALELGRSSLDLNMRTALRWQESLAEELVDTSEGQAAFVLDGLLPGSGASEMTLLGANGHIIASSSTDPTALVPSQPGEDILLLVRQRQPYVGLDTIRDLGLYIRVVVPIPLTGETGLRMLQGLYPVPASMRELATSVEEAFSQYRELAYLRTPLKTSFTLTLSLVLLFALLAAFWLAFVSARRLTAPIRDLVMGTRAVAAGDYSQRLPQPGNDDLGMLVRSFNEMTRRLAQSRDETQRSQREVEQQKAYLEVVLGNLSSGVVSFDHDFTLRTANRAAEQILDVPLALCLGQTLETITAENEHLEPLLKTFRERTRLDVELAWQAEVTLFGARGRQVLICRGTTLGSDDPGHAGLVLVFDDITTLIQAQRDAAWGEVARRLAHEIKNPLTPIQLSAERLRHKFTKSMPEDDRALLERHTETIVRQVELMKGMVNAFSEYARPPRLERAPLELNPLVEELVELYRGSEGGVLLETDLDAHLPAVEADAGRMRQLLHNLLKNAIEALAGQSGGRVLVRTRSREGSGAPLAEIRISDNGPGIPAAVRERLFEPYMTTKPRGTGLGLAIVKKIVEEHGGMIDFKEPRSGGVSISVRLPAVRTGAVSEGGPASPPPRAHQA
ncbi:MAG: ATP-binding protein [Gammaproteobacteria bacterium]|nr:ATP-binding protein [Gammaproteobacteria bacterium]